MKSETSGNRHGLQVNQGMSVTIQGRRSRHNLGVTEDKFVCLPQGDKRFISRNVKRWDKRMDNLRERERVSVLSTAAYSVTFWVWTLCNLVYSYRL